MWDDSADRGSRCRTNRDGVFRPPSTSHHRRLAGASKSHQGPCEDLRYLSLEGLPSKKSTSGRRSCMRKEKDAEMATRRIQSRVSGKANSFSGSGTANSRRRDPCGRIDYMKPRFYCTFAATWSGNRSDPRWQPRPHSRCGAYCCTDMLRALVTQTAEDETMLRRIQYGVLTVGLTAAILRPVRAEITAQQVREADRARRRLSQEQQTEPTGVGPSTPTSPADSRLSARWRSSTAASA